MSNVQSNGTRILWIEEQFNEYDLLDDLGDVAGTNGLVDVTPTIGRGYELLTKEHYDLVLLDLMLPWTEQELKTGLVQLNGGEWLLNQLRHNQGWATASDCYVVVLTARGNRETLHRVLGLLESNGEVLSKPLHVTAIIERVRSALARTK